MSRSVTTGFSFVVAAKVVVLVVGIVASPLLVRYLGAEPYGSYVFLFSLFSLYMTLVSSGVTDGVRKFLSADRSVPNWEERVLAFYLRYAAVLAILGAAALILVEQANLLERFIDGGDFGLYLWLLAVLVIGAQFRTYVRRALMGFKLEQYSESLRVLYKISFLVGAIAFVILGHGVAGVLVAHILTSALVGVTGLAFLSRRVSLWGVLFSSTRDLPRREMLSFNNLSVVLIVLLTSLYHVDVVLLRVFQGETSAAYYKVALLFAEFLWFVPVALQTVLLQSTSELFERDDYARIKAMSARITRYTTLLTALMGIGIAVLASSVIPLLYSPEFLAGVGPLLVLLPGAFGFAVARPILSIGQASGDLRSLVIGTTTAAVMNVVLNLALIPRFGMLGAAVATTTSYGSMLAFHVWSARNIGFDPLADIRLTRTLATVVFTAPVLYLLAGTLPSDLLAIVVVPPAGLAVFTLAAFLTGALDPIEVTHFLGALPGPFGPFSEGVRKRFAGRVDGGTPSESNVQRWLFAVGALFFVVGIVVSVAGAGLGPVLGGTDDPNQNATSAPTGTTEPTPTSGGQTSTTEPAGTTQETTGTTSGPSTTNGTSPPGTTQTTSENETTTFGTTTSTFGTTTTEETTSTTTFGTTTTTTTFGTTTTEETTTSTETSTSTSTETSTSTSTATSTTTTSGNSTTTTTENNSTTTDDGFL